MATTIDFIEYVCEQIHGVGDIRYRKMFGEYMVYVDDKPILLVCDNTVYVKILDCVEDLLKDADTGKPYDSAKEHYILDIDDINLSKQVINTLLPVVKVPKKRTKKK